MIVFWVTRPNIKKTVIILLICFFSIGCVPLVLKLSPGLLSGFSESVFEECDTQFAKQAIPAQLKLLEGLLKNDPENKEILVSLAMGFCGYSLLFAESDDPEYASRLYLRSRDYALKALGQHGIALLRTNTDRESVSEILNRFGVKDLPALLWSTVSWNSWINLNLSDPLALSQFGISQACIKRLLEIEPEYFYGLPLILEGISHAARYPVLGGDIKTAKESFSRAIALTEGRFFLAQYYYARYYAYATQDKKMFIRLLKQVIDQNHVDMHDICLINSMIKVRAQELLEEADEIFLD